MTRISTACSWVNIGSLCKAAILAQVGHFYSGGVGQYYSGANTLSRTTTVDLESYLEIVTMRIGR